MAKHASTSSSGGGESASSDAVHECHAADFLSSITGVITIAKYNVHGHVIEVETAIIKEEDPTPDLSAGWNILGRFEGYLRIQRVLG